MIESSSGSGLSLDRPTIGRPLLGSHQLADSTVRRPLLVGSRFQNLAVRQKHKKKQATVHRKGIV